MSQSRWHPARAAPLLLLVLSGCAATREAIAPDPQHENRTAPPPETPQEVLTQLSTDPLVLDLLDEIGDSTIMIAGVTLTRGQGRGNIASGDAATQEIARAALTFIFESAVSDAGS